MDFLRRLAPPRDTDASRAVAVLPSRFASVAPPHSASAPAWLAGPVDEGAFVPLREAAPAQRPPLATVAPRQPGGEQFPRDLPPQVHGPVLRPDSVPPGPWVRAAPAVPAVAVALAAARASGDREFTETQPIAPGDAHPAPLPVVPARQRVAAMPPTQARIGAPLSPAVVAQRVQVPRGDSPVVQVTIGRIDVMAAAPPPTARHGPKAPRPAAMSLADYLRAGSRR